MRPVSRHWAGAGDRRRRSVCGYGAVEIRPKAIAADAMVSELKIWMRRRRCTGMGFLYGMYREVEREIRNNRRER